METSIIINRVPERLIILVRSENSLIKFKLGGALILPADNRNHHSVIAGNKDNIPLFISILRD